jgi:glycosyltransferase involved in cell wall biosynthesis
VIFFDIALAGVYRKMKKILLVIHTPPPFGGGEVQALNLKRHFTNNPKFIIFDYSRKNHNRTNWSTINLNTIFHGILWIIKVGFLIIKYQPSKIYFTLPKSYFGFLRNMMVLPLSHLLGVKVYGELPGTSFLFLQNKNSIKYRTGLYFLRRVDEIRFLSPSIALAHKQYGLKRPIVINNGIDILPGNDVSPDIFLQNPLTLVYIGAIESSKGVFNMLKAIKICHANHIDIHLNFIGYWTYNDEKDQANEFIKNSGINDLITFHGIQTGGKKWEILSHCAVLVHPTFWDGVPLTILEALGIGIPVISTSIGGIPDTITNDVNGIILPENTPEELANAINKYYDNRQLLIEVSKANKALFNDKYKLEIFLSNMRHWFES